MAQMGMLSVSSLRLSAPALVDDQRGLEAVLVVSPDPGRRAELGDVVDTGGWVSTTVGSMQEAVWELTPVLPQLVVIDVPDPTDSEWALELIDRIRGHNGGERTPVVLLTPLEHRALTVAAFGRRADDVVAGPAYADELIARFRIRLERPPVPRGGSQDRSDHRRALGGVVRRPGRARAGTPHTRRPPRRSRAPPARRAARARSAATARAPVTRSWRRSSPSSRKTAATSTSSGTHVACSRS